VIAAVAPPLDPSPDRARELLVRELARPEYHDRDLLGRLQRWVERVIDGTVDAASGRSALTTFVAILVVLTLVLGLAVLLSRAGRSATLRSGRVLPAGAGHVTAAALRDRAERALADGRAAEAVVDGFRAIAVRQAERGRIDDLPAATAHEVALAVAGAHPEAGGAVHRTAMLFDAVLYGDRPASTEQASGVLALDDELAAR
jgi:hypothetical protein